MFPVNLTLNRTFKLAFEKVRTFYERSSRTILADASSIDVMQMKEIIDTHLVQAYFTHYAKSYFGVGCLKR